MGLFTFIIILVVSLSLIEAGTKVLAPVARRLADLLAENAREKRARREGLEAGPLPVQVVEELESRLARIEDRLDFLEELRATPARRSLVGGEDAPRDAG